jgi:hypothetical protein
MLDHYYVRPRTADRVRALWLGSPIDQYAAWASERGAAKATVTAHLQTLIHFDRFAHRCGAATWTDLPALVEPFVDQDRARPAKAAGPTGQPDPTTPVFASDRGHPLTRFGIYKRVRQHAAAVESTAPSSSTHITPHVFRHSTAVHLLEAGVEVNVIRGWLGHVSLETTKRYAEITVRMKEAALKLCEPPTTGTQAARKPTWRDDATLLTWLSSL